MIYDCIIVGDGLAGSLLAKRLLDAQKKVLIISDPSMPSSSAVAGGMINPATGKYLTPTWLMDELFNKLDDFYRYLEQELSAKFYHKIGIYRPFANEENKSHFISQIKKNNLENRLEVLDDNLHKELLTAPLGGLMAKDGGWVDVPTLLQELNKLFISKKCYLAAKFCHSDYTFEGSTISYGGYKAEKIIFCEGYFVKDNPMFNWLPFNPVKGETLIATIKSHDLQHIVNQGKWIIPIDENQIRIGSTYTWHELDFVPSLTANDQLIAGAKKILSKNFEISGHHAGVRPSTKDRRPIIGQHPVQKSVYLFNGLGTKGVSLAPYFVDNFIDYLYQKKDIHPDTTIERFFSLYS